MIALGRAHRAKASAAAIITALVILGAPGSARACDWRDASGHAVFPLQTNLGGRHLLDATGRPFLIAGDSPWSLIADLTREDADLYLRDRKNRGFNTLLVNLIEHRFTRDAPANAYGDRPFLREGDFSMPNPAYFDHAVRVLEQACDLGFLVLLAPAYAGYGGGGDGWYADMVINGAEPLKGYGTFVAERFGHLANIVWVQGGDYDPPDKDLVRALVAGIDEAAPGAIHTVHGAPETPILDYWAGEPWLAINNVYTYGNVHEAATEQFRRHGDRPFFFFEGAYENEFGAGGHRVRMQAYQALLSGASGQLFGNNPIWHFDGPGLHPKPMEWKEALDSPGAVSMTVLIRLFSDLEWWRLEPDISGRLLLQVRGRVAERAVAAIADDGSFAMAYYPSAHNITMNLGALSGERVQAAWLDPSTGETREIPGSPFASIRRSFRPPGRNAAGDGDWVLVLEAVGAEPA